jgi:lysyl oxidase-like protein 2/3/4
LGFPAGGKATHSSQFGKAKRIFWMDNVRCNGNEKELISCQFNGWAQHDCDFSESAGVICNDTTNLVPVTKKLPPLKKIKINMNVRIQGGRTENEGRVEVKFGNNWGSICPNGFSLAEANVICKQLKLGYAYEALQTDFFETTPIIISGTKCIGNETDISNCYHYVPENIFCEQQNPDKPVVAGIVCRDKMADLVIDFKEIEQTAHLEDRPMYFLQCGR